jgi:hypothetical protein
LNLNEEQILNLVPDEPSKKAGKDLANIAKWATNGANELALWGECQGSGSKPYQTQIDIANIAFKCSCPSRKFPCKHGLGLMLLYARQKNNFTENSAPSWVTEWLNKRVEKEEKKATKEEKPVDEVAQAKRQEARASKVSDGIAELNLWIKDIIRNGILSMPEKGFSFFENMAKRMVDAQSPGLANMIRSLGETNFFSDNWHTGFMEQLLNIYLISEGYKTNQSNNNPFNADLKNWIGFTQNQEELKTQSGTNDIWLVLAKQTTELDQITTERFWLHGYESNQYALVLQFNVRGQGGNLNLTPGMSLQAELVFFPSVSPLRALIKKQIATEKQINVNLFNNWNEVTEIETQLYATFPVRSERPYMIKKLKPIFHNNEWWLMDKDDQMMLLKNEQNVIWKLLSISGGQPMDMAVIGKGNKYEPVGIWEKAYLKL